jgi:hypothetical protein
MISNGSTEDAAENSDGVVAREMNSLLPWHASIPARWVNLDLLHFFVNA